jgi:hypothetical protein
MFKILVFWAALRLAAFACPFAFLFFMRFCQPVQLIAFGSCCFQIYGFLMPCDGMLDGVLRVRAAPDKRHPRWESGQGGTGRRKKGRSFSLLLFQNPLHPVSRATHLHAQTNVVKPQIPNSTAEQSGAWVLQVGE